MFSYYSCSRWIKSIPRKNIRLLAGKPLLAYSIEQALSSKNISRVVVSTDDREIATVAQQYGAEVIWRPVEISGDTASSESALMHVLDYLEQQEDYKPELVVFMQCTSPIRREEDIDQAIATLRNAQADSLAFCSTLARFYLAICEQSGAILQL